MKREKSIVVAHASPGRTRLRLNWLARAPEEAVALADALVALEGMLEVRTRASTGSVLCLHDTELLGVEGILLRVAELTGVRPQPRARPPRQRTESAGSVAAALLDGVKDLDRDVRDVSNGRVDLGTLAAAGFLALGATEVMVTRKLPMPPWFNLAWWAFRTFTAFGHEDGEPDADLADFGGE